MGQQAFINRLALGRSPYQAPERPEGATAELGNSTHPRVSPLYADGYVQHYDERGHPVNPESKAFGRDLRRAKNDILSTMGVVVSEEGNSRGPTDEEKMDTINVENDYGLVMATLDQISVFLGSWWTTSLSGRIQTFQSYTHVPLLNIIARERGSSGIVGFYFAGIPSWALSTCLSICRHHPLERVIVAMQSYFPDDDVLSKIVRSSFTILHSGARGTLLFVAIQSYVYGLLQSLHLVQPYSLPGIQFLLPFGETSALPLPSLPTDLSVQSLVEFGSNLLTTPSLLVYLYLYLRPIVEIRLYRLIRRRLPKPTFADHLSIKVARENDLIDWMVPMLGRRQAEESARSNLSFVEDVLYELKSLRNWMLSWIGRSPDQKAHIRLNREWAAGLSARQNERHHRSRRLQQAVPPAPEEVAARVQRATYFDQPSTPVSAPVPDSTLDFSGDRVLSNEEEPISQSPAEMSTHGISAMASMGRSDTVAHTDETTDLETRGSVEDHGDPNRHRNSRSNTLFSRPSSPETSSPTSPHVRASLIHQNPDMITMQLELMGNRGEQDQAQLRPRPGNEIDFPNTNGDMGHRHSITELLDTLSVIYSDAVDSDRLSNMTPGGSPEPGQDIPRSVPQQHQFEHEFPDPSAEEQQPSFTNILPESVEEPRSQEDTYDHQSEAGQIMENDSESAVIPRISDPNVREESSTNTTIPKAHRITILSSHPIDSLASHLASMITCVLFIPLESLYLRSLASSYLSSTVSSAVDVRAIGAWGGGGSRSSRLAYMGKLTLMVGLQAAVNASVWGVVSGTAIRIGRKFCGWGTL
ncbi:hypothetical protein BDV25DRAFT_158025 [Aspergillus avenaceus]|uniref:Uncharacterized protein n=1 Tax=Aspergillus avenaceus TaxID=36643 RepID=A0A5N6TQJ0_ASPAV|nr:hypothetical protein BDV25DRAFT_158025 [Aspergillus avenaceus]